MTRLNYFCQTFLLLYLSTLGKLCERHSFTLVGRWNKGSIYFVICVSVCVHTLLCVSHLTKSTSPKLLSFHKHPPSVCPIPSSQICVCFLIPKNEGSKNREKLKSVLVEFKPTHHLYTCLPACESQLSALEREKTLWRLSG